MAATLEERFTLLEKEVARLRAEVDSRPARANVTGRTSPDFLDTMIGIHANSPAFEEVTRQIEAERERERDEARRLSATDNAES